MIKYHISEFFYCYLSVISLLVVLHLCLCQQISYNRHKGLEGKKNKTELTICLHRSLFLTSYNYVLAMK